MTSWFGGSRVSDLLRRSRHGFDGSSGSNGGASASSHRATGHPGGPSGGNRVPPTQAHSSSTFANLGGTGRVVNTPASTGEAWPPLEDGRTLQATDLSTKKAPTDPDHLLQAAARYQSTVPPMKRSATRLGAYGVDEDENDVVRVLLCFVD